jgi:hypothetical protein
MLKFSTMKLDVTDYHHNYLKTHENPRKSIFALLFLQLLKHFKNVQISFPQNSLRKKCFVTIKNFMVW